MNRDHGWVRGNCRDLLAWVEAETERDYGLVQNLAHRHGMCLDHLVHHDSCRRGHLLAHGGIQTPLFSCGLLRQLCRPRSGHSTLVCGLWAVGIMFGTACLLLNELQFLGL